MESITRLEELPSAFNAMMAKIDELSDELKDIKKMQDIKPKETKKEPLLTIEEVCELTHRKKSTIYNLTHRRIIPFKKQGNKLYFKQSEILAWIEGESNLSAKKREDEARGYFSLRRFSSRR